LSGQWAQVASWDAGLADLPTVADEIDVKGVDSIRRHKSDKQIMGAVGGHLRPNEAETSRYAMHMGINRHHWQPVREEEYTGGGLRSHAIETREPCAAIRDWQLLQETKIERASPVQYLTKHLLYPPSFNVAESRRPDNLRQLLDWHRGHGVPITMAVVCQRVKGCAGVYVRGVLRKDGEDQFTDSI